MNEKTDIKLQNALKVHLNPNIIALIEKWHKGVGGGGDFRIFIEKRHKGGGALRFELKRGAFEVVPR